MTIEELENKILDGDFDEYTLDEYRAKICNEQKNHYINKACEVYRKELSEIISLLNKFGKKLYGINMLGELISLDGSVNDFRKAMEEEP